MTTQYDPLPIRVYLPQPSVRQETYPTIVQAFRLSMVLGGCQTLFGIILFIFFIYTLKPYYLQPILFGLMSLASFILIIGYGMVRGDVSPARALPYRGFSITLVIPLLISVIGLCMLLTELSNIIQWLIPIPHIASQYFDGLINNKDRLWQSFTLLVIIAPLTEEAFFRGLILSGFTENYRRWTAILMSAALFGFAHLNPWQGIPAFFGGILMGWWFVRTRSLWPGMMAHAINNALPFIFLLFPKFDLPGVTRPLPGKFQFLPLWFDLSGLGLLTIGTLLSLLMLRFFGPKPAEAVPATSSPPSDALPLARPSGDLAAGLSGQVAGVQSRLWSQPEYKIIDQLPSRTGFTIGQATILMLLFVAMQLVLGVIVTIVGQSMNVPILEQPWVTAAVNTCAFLLVIGVGAFWSRMSMAQLVPLTAVPLWLFLPMTLTLLGLSALLSEASNYLVWLLPPPAIVSELMNKLLGGEEHPWQSLLLLVVVAPVTEELMCRGLMLRGLLRNCSALTAVLTTAILFAVMHLNPWQGLTAFFLGLLFGWWVVRTNSLWPAIYGHAVNNGLLPLLAVLDVHIKGYTSSSGHEIVFQEPWFNLLGAALFMVGLALTAFAFSRIRAKNHSTTVSSDITARPILCAEPVEVTERS